MQLTLGRATFVIGGIVCALFLVTTTSDRYALDQLKIGGPAFEKIVTSKDFASDFSSPPLLLIEPYLALQSSQAQRNASRLKQRMNELHAKFIERRDYWARSREIPEQLKLQTAALARDAEEFWNEASSVFLPALERNDAAALASSRTKLETTFEKHYAEAIGQAKSAKAFARASERSAEENERSLSIINYAIIIAVLNILALIYFIVRNKLTKPLELLSSYMTRLAKKDPCDPPECRGCIIEIEQMLGAVVVFGEAAEQKRLAEEDAAAQRAKVLEQQKDRENGFRWYVENRDFFFKEFTNGMERFSRGDLEARLEKPFIKDYEKLRETFNVAAERLHSAMKSIVVTYGTIYSSTQDISRAANDLSRRNEEQAATLEETAAAVGAITDATRKTAENAREARAVIDSAISEAATGENIVGDAITAMSGIEKSTGEINQFITLIDEIAFQTNLLALNAGVEAARAGDAGKGFAVVANEVRGLAQRSAEAAREIKTLVSSCDSKVRDGVAFVAESGKALRRIVDQVNRIGIVVKDIAESAEHQSNGLREINLAVHDIDHVTQQNAAMAEETSASSESLTNDSSTLYELVGKFKIGEVGVVRRGSVDSITMSVSTTHKRQLRRDRGNAA